MDILSYNSIILEYEECRYTIVFKHLCGDCGIDLKQLNTVLSISNSAKTTISMEPSFPDLTITRKEALKFGKEEYNHLLRKRKLHLLVDLDQTLVHTTDSKNPYPSSSDVVTYQLNAPISQTFYTKVRPGVKKFLTNLQSLYQFHVVTFGDRPYANAIAKLIDPHKIFFSHRILSRDECLSLTHKTANMSSLFPCGDSLVCIIDDRDDVWEYASNLVQVKPYMWFKDVGNIHAMYLSSLTETNEEKHQQGKKRKFIKESDELSEKLPTSNNSNVTVDADLYLHQLEIILKRIHKTFYANYDQRVQGKHEVMPDLKQIMPEIRRQILNSVSLCFSGLLPQNFPMEKHRATMMAKAMGAKVTYDLHIDSNYTNRTTHVIAGEQTMKVHRALQNNIKVVTPEWLIDCYEQYEKKTKENYILTPEYDVQKSRLCTLEIPRVSKRNCSDMQQKAPRKRSQINDSNLSNMIALKDSLGQCNISMSTDEHFDMEKEVDEVWIEDDKDSNDIQPRPLKQQRTGAIIERVNENPDNNANDDGFDLDSSTSRKFNDFNLSKQDGNSSDEEFLDDDS